MSVGSTNNVDEWVLSNEKWLRDGDHANDWKHGLVTLNDADSFFPNSTEDHSGRITITRPESLFPGYEVLCEAREARITIQPSAEAFKRAFAHMSDGLLKNLNWSNVFVAGGIVLSTLLSVDSTDGQPHRDPRWNSSDIDVYIYRLSPNEANEKVKHIFETFCANLPPGSETLVVRNCTTITFYARYPLRRIQIVLKLAESPKTVLLNFDLDICAMGWDGATLWMLPRTARALEMACNVTQERQVKHPSLLPLSDHGVCIYSIFKYADKGYGIRFLPSYISSLATRESASNDSTSETPRDRDLVSIAAEQRKWTAREMAKKVPIMFVRIADQSLSAVPSRCLKGFRIFMRCATLWEMAHRGTIILKGDIWAATDYHQDETYRDAITTYDDVANVPYEWNEKFHVGSFEQYIWDSNAREILEWIQSDDYGCLSPHGVVRDEYRLPNDGRPYDELEEYQRVTCAPTVDAVLSPDKDLVLQALLPREFAAYASRIVGNARAQQAGVVPQREALAPAVPHVRPNSVVGLYYWRIGKELMWQQLDRRVDEVFEMLHAFRRVHMHLSEDHSHKAPDFCSQLARRALYDEFDAFSRWVHDDSLTVTLYRDYEQEPVCRRTRYRPRS
ncbi:hypothetical protein DFH08DRAFT_969591 [Mycena albidolilacea]|uniref:Uncharacterized protein n=1 Tax=Mycena albidolilacea TaxID=1033008 RepID=A0AAD6ZHL1_9AGAR|nr:hypothetical protein DFH08DRAFT_969591 [Mycena albidolilacea]